MRTGRERDSLETAGSITAGKLTLVRIVEKSTYVARFAVQPSVGCGLLFGIVAAAFLLRLAQGLFFGVQRFDPYAFAIAIFGLLLCGAVAVVIPAFRAIRIDPAQALRVE